MGWTEALKRDPGAGHGSSFTGTVAANRPTPASVTLPGGSIAILLRFAPVPKRVLFRREGCADQVHEGTTRWKR